MDRLLEEDDINNMKKKEKKIPQINKNRRRKKINRGNRKAKETLLCMMSVNAAQLKGKLNSFKSELKLSNAAIFSVQETHYATKGKVQIENFEVFESIRKKGERGNHDRCTQGAETFLN